MNQHDDDFIFVKGIPPKIEKINIAEKQKDNYTGAYITIAILILLSIIAMILK